MVTTTKQKHTVESVVCYPVNIAKLNKEVNEFIHHGKADNITYEIIGSHALIKEPISAIINDEFVGGDVEKSVTWYVHENELMSDGSHRCTCAPTKEITMSLEELEEYLGEPVTLAEFTRERRGYNARIERNEGMWVAAFNRNS